MPRWVVPRTADIDRPRGWIDIDDYIQYPLQNEQKINSWLSDQFQVKTELFSEGHSLLQHALQASARQRPLAPSPARGRSRCAISVCQTSVWERRIGGPLDSLLLGACVRLNRRQYLWLQIPSGVVEATVAQGPQAAGPLFIGGSGNVVGRQRERGENADVAYTSESAGQIGTHGSGTDSDEVSLSMRWSRGKTHCSRSEGKEHHPIWDGSVWKCAKSPDSPGGGSLPARRAVLTTPSWLKLSIFWSPISLKLCLGGLFRVLIKNLHSFLVFRWSTVGYSVWSKPQ